jgi:hypothetical protein
MKQAISRRDIVQSNPTSLRHFSSPDNNFVSELQNLTLKDAYSRQIESVLARTNVHSQSLRRTSTKSTNPAEMKPLTTHERLKSAIMRHKQKIEAWSLSKFDNKHGRKQSVGITADTVTGRE